LTSKYIFAESSEARTLSIQSLVKAAHLGPGISFKWKYRVTSRWKQYTKEEKLKLKEHPADLEKP
jgi:hypothetical protein